MWHLFRWTYGTIIVAAVEFVRCHTLPQTGEYTGLCYEPKMTDLMNEIAVKLPDKWQDIGRGLGLEECELTQIETEHSSQQSPNPCFSSVFEKWHSGECSTVVVLKLCL